MNEQESNERAEPSPRRLLRSRDDRVILGVAGGLAQYLRIDPTLVRVGFVATALFGGFGIVAYLVLALAAPEDDGSGRPIVGQRPPIWLIVAAGIGLAVIIPGPFWGAFDGVAWWWGWGAWLLLIAGVAGVAYLILRDRDAREAGPRGGPSPAPAALGGEDDDTEPPTRELGATSPSEAPTAAASVRAPGPHPVVRAIAIAALAVLAIGAAGAVAVASAWTVATGNGEISATLVIALGVILIAAAFTGTRRAGWLVVPALVIGLPAGATAASEIRFDGDIGEREYRPGTAAAIPEDGYSLGVGQLVVDLHDLAWGRRETVELVTDLGVGETIVSVPSNVCVEVDASASAGELYVRGERSAGVDPDLSEDPASSEGPRLVLDSRVDLGRLTVSEQSPEQLTGHDRFGGPRDDHENDVQERLDARLACEA